MSLQIPVLLSPPNKNKEEAIMIGRIQACLATSTLSVLLSVHALGGSVAAADLGYAVATTGTRLLALEGAGVEIKVLVEEATLGGTELELGELTIPSKFDSGGHPHGSMEIFYMLSGEMEHVVEGEAHVLKPGMVGTVRAGDEVTHRCLSDTPCKSLVIWAPGGEVARIEKGFGMTSRALPLQ